MLDETKIEDQRQPKLAHESTKKMQNALFGFNYSAEIISAVLVIISIFLAVMVPYSGLFPTSQSEEMTNYHRWLYDQFVIVSCFIGIVLYFRLKQLRYNQKFRMLWRSYIQANAEFKFYRYQKAHHEGKLPFLHTKKGEYIALLCLIIGIIAFFIFLTPSETSRRGNFFIQAWWPINALIIGVLYYSQIWLYLRLIAASEITDRYLLFILQAERNEQKLSKDY